MSTGQRAVIVSAARTPMGSFNGAFSSMPAPTLGSLAIAEAVNRIHLPGEQVDEVVMGCVLSAGLGQARRDRRPSARDFPTRSEP